MLLLGHHAGIIFNNECTTINLLLHYAKTAKP